MSLLELRAIDKSYCRGGWFGKRDRVQVLKNVSLSLEEGACLGLLGRSGSGKSTLSRIALGLEPPDAGKILFQGRERTGLGRRESLWARKDLQVVFQNSLGSVNPRMTAGQVVAEPIGNFESVTPSELRSRVGRLLETVGLKASDAEKLPHQFSGGQLQRVCIARAIALKPRLVILDEAVSSLDMVVQTRILDLLATLRRELGTSYLFISHDIRVILRMADALAVLHEGEIVGYAEHMDKVGAIEHPVFKALMGAVLPAFPGRRRDLHGNENEGFRA
jgi:nickel transport system ATP-binding protein